VGFYGFSIEFYNFTSRLCGIGIIDGHDHLAWNVDFDHVFNNKKTYCCVGDGSGKGPQSQLKP
jgi:hypothetical protein